MAVLTAQESMLYCPKCRASYEEGAQRFCTYDGIRLLPGAAQSKTGGASKGVFTNLLNRALSPEEKKKKELAPLFAPANEPLETVFQPPIESPVFQPEDVPAEREIPPQAETKKTEQPSKPLPRLIRPNEIASSQAQLGDRSVNPTGRAALTWENTEILLGQTIKGRYRIVEKLSEDELSIAYLAEDKIVPDRKAVVRVLMIEKDADDYLSKIFAEERVSLSHINHPNIAHLFDSGELPEGNVFIVTEYIEGDSLKERLRHSGTFNPLRAARVVRQAANALNEAHLNGILHRNLKPQNIILGLTENGVEQIKVTDFAVYDGFEEQTEENIKYISPEQLAGKMPSYASDIYSLAAIAFQMLTGRLPFNYSTEKELLKAQKEGLSLRPTNLRLDLSPQVDEILEKALAYDPADRYPKARDFGDAFYNSLASAPWEKSAEKVRPKEEKPFVAEKEEAPPETEPPAEIAAAEVRPEEKIVTLASEPAEAEKTTRAAEHLPWEKRSPEPLQTANTTRMLGFALGLLLLGIGTWASWNYFSKRQGAPVYVPQNNSEIANAPNADPNQNGVISGAENVNLAPAEPTPMEIESPPLPRQITAPPNFIYFQNSKEKLSGELAKNFRAFSFYYPSDWVKGESDTNFVDVARVGATGTPIEQMLIGYYESKGTLAADKEKYSKLVEESNKFFAAELPNYRLVSEGETKINGEWKAYEIRFQGEGKTKNGDYVTIWGRRLWIPAARQGIKSGFVVTLLATSLSPEVKSVDDVGVKGELAAVLATFEPASLDAPY